jgi:hypothetical protein
VHGISHPSLYSRCSHTNKEHQAFCRGFLCLHTMLSHAMDDGAHKVNGEDAVNVDKMEHHRHNKETVPPELRHGKDCGGKARLPKESPM